MRDRSSSLDTQDPGVSSGLLVLRVVVGLVFFMHGWQKLVDNGISATQQGFDGMGVMLPDITAVIVTFVELIGGAMLIAGFLTRIAGVLLVIDMIAALFIVHVENGFFAANGGFELVFLLAGGALALVIAGPGAYSADAMVGFPGLARNEVIGTRLAARR
ncbi:MAG TPA: DoxX family protein [Thermomicrobiales bacterium]|nr:DoxX family protein [Thermomicrobiales bacterium]